MPDSHTSSKSITRRHVFPKGRVFKFIDETGDPGHPSLAAASRYYQLNMVILHRDSFASLFKHLAAFRYFKDSGKELKRHVRDAKILADVCSDLAHNHNIFFVSFVMNKEKYVGPYLDEENARTFKNFIILKALQYVHMELIQIRQENNMEVVFDRYLESERDEVDLRAYLRQGHGIPSLEKIIQADSEYSEALQIADYVGRFVKDYFFDDNQNIDIFDFISVFNIEDPDNIKTKSP